ncbi:MAG: 2-hydroxychromene-2-carboxylate isomerase [Sedimenticola sp.]|nr:2-hydroxychromene-2-carboxylate isomerase [Sedimenticola sp.]
MDGMNAPRTIEWFYDFISPYAYLASQALDRLPPDIGIERVPILFAGILKRWDTRGPGEIGPMRRFTYRQIAWLAEKNGIPLTFPPIHPFNPLKLLRLNIALGASPEVTDRLFRFVWGEGKSSDDPVAWAALLEECGLSEAQADERTNDPDIKKRLLENTERAIERGVFGVPAFLVGDEVFWGFDSIPFINDFIADPNLLQTPALQQADRVGEGIKRR